MIGTERAAKIVGATVTQLRNWARWGWVMPGGCAGSGGGGYLWRFDDLLRAAVLVSVYPPTGRRGGEHARFGERFRGVGLVGDWLLLDPYVAACTPEQVRDLAAKRPVTVIALAETRRALAGRLARVPDAAS